jgi:hypothetical protein
MSTDLVTTVSCERLEKLEKLAFEDGGHIRLKYVQGVWKVDEEKVNGKVLTLQIDRVGHGYRKWVEQQPIQGPIEYVGVVDPNRAELGDTDESKWSINSEGAREDPWRFTFFVYLIDEEDMIYAWSTDSVGGIRAVRGLLTAWTNRMRRGKGGLPVVVLESGQFPSRRYGTKDKPVLRVLRWTDEDVAPASAPALSAQPISATIVSGPEKLAAAVKAQKQEIKMDDVAIPPFDDEIPL